MGARRVISHTRDETDCKSHHDEREWKRHQMGMQIRIEKSEKRELVDRVRNDPGGVPIPPSNRNTQRVMIDDDAGISPPIN